MCSQLSVVRQRVELLEWSDCVFLSLTLDTRTSSKGWEEVGGVRQRSKREPHATLSVNCDVY